MIKENFRVRICFYSVYGTLICVDVTWSYKRAKIPAIRLDGFLPSANEVCEGYVFTGVCLSTGGRGHSWLPGGHAWLMGGMCSCWGGMRGCRGACVVAGGCAWLWGACMVTGGVWLLGGCVVARGGVHGCQGVCMVVGCVWFLGGMRGCWGACMVARGACVGYDEIRSMSGRYASYWNAFLLFNNFTGKN